MVFLLALAVVQASGAPPSVLQINFQNQGAGPAHINWTLGGYMLVQPGIINFGEPAVGSVNPYSITLTNDGPTTIHMLPISLTGENAKDFTFVSHCPVYLMFRNPKVLAPAIDPHTQCAIDVTFKPTVTGARFAVLTIFFAALKADPPASLNISSVYERPAPPSELQAVTRTGAQR